MTQLWTGTDYAPRNSQNQNPYSGTQIPLSHYSNSGGVPYFNSNGNNHYSAMSPSYSTYSAPFIPSQHAAGQMMYMQPPGALSMPYQTQPPPGATLASQHRSMSQHSFYSPSAQSTRVPPHHPRIGLPPEVSLADTEDQESPNQETMRSEHISPPLDGYPNVNDFDELMRQYVRNLSPKKQDKALIHAKRAANIKAVLIDKKTTSVESAQFRFWVKKMFTLEPRDASIAPRRKKICHEGKPVAIREKLFKILTRAHKQCQHGGRDKTSAQVRRVYSWVPKELISRFVKLCPTCRIRRGSSRSPPSPSERSTDGFMDTQSPEPSSSSRSRHHSSAGSVSSSMQSPLQMSRFSSAFQQQNRWMTPLQPAEKGMNDVTSLEEAASAMVTMNMDSPISPEGLTPTSPKFAGDPGTPYLTSSNTHTGASHSHFGPGGFVDVLGMQEQQHNNNGDYRYRGKRGPGFKRGKRY